MTRMLELRGFRADRGRFLLTTGLSKDCDKDSNFCWSSPTTVHILERDFVDFQRWDRLLRRASSYSTSCPRFPTKRLRKLSKINWRRGKQSAGWRIELQKNVKACENWLNAAFAQLSMLQQREFLDEDLYTAAKRKQMALREDNKHARDLQQYFTSKELVDVVVRRVLEYIKQRDVVWLEPSCGDGRFLTALLRAGAHGVRAQVCLGDFLVSRSCISTDKLVVAIGNPPFGARGDDGRDLVHHFFQHAAREWRAGVIAFISWKLITQLPLTDYQFEFRERDKLKLVRQPSVFQLFAQMKK
ncbi:unnamed protein product [Peronospora destructor]|uniref:DNA methylase adenine-specific domain-containing protein n=1 Tax=Peronospora destructor TaxID=86335 RepID=A0AAV0VB96_9STRA|nr:unnamed protein product [Peronospora destructor]